MGKEKAVIILPFSHHNDCRVSLITVVGLAHLTVNYVTVTRLSKNVLVWVWVFFTF